MKSSPRYASTYFHTHFSAVIQPVIMLTSGPKCWAPDASGICRKGIFDKETARLFRDNVLSKGNTDDPMTLYKKFRGAEPNPVYLLKNRGFIE